MFHSLILKLNRSLKATYIYNQIIIVILKKWFQKSQKCRLICLKILYKINEQMMQHIVNLLITLTKK